ncbi:Rha family transcriptional regulator [Shewanella sp. SR43-8]|uniref:Rha family transcriptional regulator n=1 Tax=Shewanella sp. SR43-8 TaxID=2760938 RepID=UPI0015FFD966|nr:Rha family transcriptional regulator [Shewanella sp. SR43-8]MBB1320592.1 Rha family transcriptional regulator [Shewanella sp. SR43-8]
MHALTNQNHPTQLVFINDKQTITNSQVVADYFGKKHYNVLRKIDEIITDAPIEFTSTHFRVHAVKLRAGAVNRDSKIYEMTKDGFMFLVMGFTGAKAAELKINFINAFNEAQKRLSRTQHPFERQRMMFTWEGGKIVSSQPIDDDQFVTSRDKLVQYMREPRFLSLEQLLEISEAANQQIATLARLAEKKARLR